MKNLFQRTFSGIIYLVLVIGALFMGKYTYGALFFAIGLLAVNEYYTISGFSIPGKVPVIGYLSGAAVFVLGFLGASGVISMKFLALVAVFPLIFLIAGLYLKKNSTRDIATLFVGFFYVSVPFAMSNLIVFPPPYEFHYTHRLFLGLLILVWINDTGAYVTGMLFGKHRLFVRISPKKSWEGFTGGTVFTIAAAFFLTRLMGILDTTDWLALAIIVCILGVFGDLTESLLKRDAGVKDSGTLIPGHGGILDRFDSLLFVVPAAVVYLLLR